MKANDFRVGNMVSYFHPAIEGFEPLIGHVIHKEEEDIIIAEYEDVSLRTYSIGGIFLTADWLKELGFKPSSHFGNGYLLNKLVLAADEQNKKFYFLDTSKRARHIKYLHQLQNLYFEIHEEELIAESPIRAKAS